LRPNDAVRKDRLLPSGVVLGKGFALRTKKKKLVGIIMICGDTTFNITIICGESPWLEIVEPESSTHVRVVHSDSVRHGRVANALRFD